MTRRTAAHWSHEERLLRSTNPRVTEEQRNHARRMVAIYAESTGFPTFDAYRDHLRREAETKTAAVAHRAGGQRLVELVHWSRDRDATVSRQRARIDAIPNWREKHPELGELYRCDRAWSVEEERRFREVAG